MMVATDPAGRDWFHHSAPDGACVVFVRIAPDTDGPVSFVSAGWHNDRRSADRAARMLGETVGRTSLVVQAAHHRP